MSKNNKPKDETDADTVAVPDSILGLRACKTPRLSEPGEAGEIVNTMALSGGVTVDMSEPVYIVKLNGHIYQLDEAHIMALVVGLIEMKNGLDKVLEEQRRKASGMAPVTPFAN